MLLGILVQKMQKVNISHIAFKTKGENIQEKLMVSTIVFFLVFTTLAFVQIKVKPPMLLAERFLNGAGWIEILLISFYGGLVAYNMHDAAKSATWRKYTWLAFTIIFFTQLFLGLLGIEKCLMTGKLHWPVPALILLGPMYRGNITFMTILFLSTVILVGPAWCSHLCYFGSIDNLMASSKAPKKFSIKTMYQLKYTILFAFILFTLIFRFFIHDKLTASLLGGFIGVVGILLMLFVSRKKRFAFHCTAFCPIATIVMWLKYLNPFRLKIKTQCDACMRCSAACNYKALNLENIKQHKPGQTCTLCGDCLSSCPHGYIYYSFFDLRPNLSRNLFLILTISLHAIFLALAKV
jgi:ferredoxin